MGQHPLIGEQRPDLRAGLRSWQVHPHIIFYAVDDDTRTVTILRVLHGRMDINGDDVEL